MVRFFWKLFCCMALVSHSALIIEHFVKGKEGFPWLFFTIASCYLFLLVQKDD
jgi:hypothetical protein